MTDNHGYNAPPEGTTDWHIPLNENFRELDSDVEIRDTKANLTNYSAKKQAKFYATDTGEILIGDGDSWNLHGVIPGSSVDGISTIRSATDFGGPADGIMAAMNDVSGPVEVRIPKGGGSGPNGEYVVSRTTDLSDHYGSGGYGEDFAGIFVDKSNVRFTSDGATVTVDSNDPNVVFCVTAGTDNNSGFDGGGTRIHNIIIEGLTLDGKKRDGVAIRGLELDNLTVRNNWIKNWQGTEPNFFVECPVSFQHHADNIWMYNNHIKCNPGSDGKRTVFWDGCHGSVARDNYVYDVSGQDAYNRMFHIHHNLDFNRPTMGVKWVGNTFHCSGRHGSRVSPKGSGTVVANNLFLAPKDTDGEELILGSRGGSERSMIQHAPIRVANNIFFNWSLILRNIDEALRGVSINGNRFVKAKNGVLTAVAFEEGPVTDSHFSDNYMINLGESDLYEASNNSGTFFSFGSSLTGFVGNTFKNNHSYNISDWYSNSSSQSNLLSDNYWKNNDGQSDPPSSTPAVRQRSKGSTSAADGDIIQHGLETNPNLEDIRRLETASSNRVYATKIDSNSLTIALEDPSGTAVKSSETVYWYVDATPSWAL